MFLCKGSTNQAKPFSPPLFCQDFSSLSLSLFHPARKDSCFLFARTSQPQKRRRKKKKIEWKKAKKGGEEGRRRQHRSRGERTKEIIRVDELGRHEQPFAVKFSSNDTFRLAEFCWFANSDFSNWTSTRGYPSRQGGNFILSNRFAPFDTGGWIITLLRSILIYQTRLTLCD